MPVQATLSRGNWATRPLLEVLGPDYPQLFEAEDPIEELYKLAREKAPYARWKAANNSGESGSSRKKRGEDP